MSFSIIGGIIIADSLSVCLFFCFFVSDFSDQRTLLSFFTDM